MDKVMKEKLGKVIELVNSAVDDPDIDIDYCIPEVQTASQACDVPDDPYILVTYAVNENTKPTYKIPVLGSTADLEGTAEEIAKRVTFFIEEFKYEIDDERYGQSD